MFLSPTSRLPTFLETTLLCVLVLYIKFTYFPGTHSLLCSCPVHQAYLNAWNPLFWTSCSIHQGYLYAGSHSLVSMFLPHILLLTSWPVSTLLYFLAPYIKVNFLLEPTLLPYFLEPTHLHILVPYIKANFFPETHFLACSCLINQGNLNSQNPLSWMFMLSTWSRSPSFLELALLYVIVPYIKHTYKPSTNVLAFSCFVHQGYFLPWNQLSPIILLWTSMLPSCPEPTFLDLFAPFIKVKGNIHTFFQMHLLYYYYFYYTVKYGRNNL